MKKTKILPIIGMIASLVGMNSANAEKKENTNVIFRYLVGKKIIKVENQSLSFQIKSENLIKSQTKVSPQNCTTGGN